MLAEANFFLIAGGTMSAVAAALHLGCILFGASWYRFFGAGVIPRLPLLRTILCAIAAVYLLRGFLSYPLMTLFPGNSMAFWLWSGAVCAAIGVVHVIGIRQAWPVVSLAGA
jgi:hypothetical protein